MCYNASRKEIKKMCLAPRYAFINRTSYCTDYSFRVL
nr:MAG TPA: hypothetical protein [Microviridae sp.]